MPTTQARQVAQFRAVGEELREAMWYELAYTFVSAVRRIAHAVHWASGETGNQNPIHISVELKPHWDWDNSPFDVKVTVDGELDVHNLKEDQT